MAKIDRKLKASWPFEALLARFHGEVWSAAEGGVIHFDSAGRRIAEEIIASHQVLVGKVAQLEAQNKRLMDYIESEGVWNNTCTKNITGRVCGNCQCKFNKGSES